MYIVAVAPLIINMTRDIPTAVHLLRTAQTLQALNRENNKLITV